MNDVYTAIDWIFQSMTTIFLFMVSNWILAFIVLVSLLGLIIAMYLSLRNK